MTCKQTTFAEFQALNYETLAQAIKAVAGLPADDLDRRIFWFTEWEGDSLFVRASDIDRAKIAASCRRRIEHIYGIKPDVAPEHVICFDALVKELHFSSSPANERFSDAVFDFWLTHLSTPRSEWSDDEIDSAPYKSEIAKREKEIRRAVDKARKIRDQAERKVKRIAAKRIAAKIKVKSKTGVA
jgi:hypothetical protein